MAELSNFKKGQFVAACNASASVTKTAYIFSVARSTFLKIMTKKEKRLFTEKKKNQEESKSGLIGP